MYWRNKVYRTTTSSKQSPACYRRVCVSDELENLGSSDTVDAESVYACLLRQCRSERCISDGKLVHDHILGSGHCLGSRLANLLIQMYGKCSDLASARAVFDNARMERTPLTWSLLISAYAQNGESGMALTLFWQMQKPESFAISSALSACANARDLSTGQRIHRLATLEGLDWCVLLQNALLNMYAKCGRLDDAMQIFHNIPTRTAVAWNAVMSAQVQEARFEHALELYRAMDAEPSDVTIRVVLTACAGLGCLRTGRNVHSRVALLGMHRCTGVQNALVGMYARCGSTHHAASVFYCITRPNVVSYTSMLTAYVLGGHGLHGLTLFNTMLLEGIHPNHMTFAAALNACSLLRNLHQGRRVWRLSSSSTRNSVLENALLNMYVRCGSHEEASRLFDIMQGNGNESAVVSWSIMISSYTEDRYKPTSALHTFRKMELEGIEPSNVTYASVIRACTVSGALKLGKEMHTRVRTVGLISDTLVRTALLDMYAKCGSLEDSLEIFSSMQIKSVVSWTAMIAAYAQHGLAFQSLRFFRELNLNGLLPDSATFVCVLRACNHAGLIDQGWDIFISMTRDYHIPPSEIHYSIAADIVGRAGRILDAEEIVCSMPCETNSLTWKTLLSTCTIHEHDQRAARVAEHAVELDPLDSMSYVMLRNAYTCKKKQSDI